VLLTLDMELELRELAGDTAAAPSEEKTIKNTLHDMAYFN